MLHDAAGIVGASFGSGNEVAARFGLLYAARYLIELYRETFEFDLSPMNCAPSWTVPVPGRYVLGSWSGSVRRPETRLHSPARPEAAAAVAFSHEKIRC